MLCSMRVFRVVTMLVLGYERDKVGEGISFIGPTSGGERDGFEPDSAAVKVWEQYSECRG